MNEKDKQVAEDAIDAVVSAIPGLGIAWGLSKAYYGAGLKLRQKKALEWVEMVRDQPEIFTKEILEQNEFQDGFVYALEKYLMERSDEKRKYFRNIFLGYVSNDEKMLFPLEKFIHVLSQLEIEDIKVIKNVYILGKYETYQIYGNTESQITNIYNLINLGILNADPASRLDLRAPFIRVSEFGEEFIDYIRT